MSENRSDLTRRDFLARPAGAAAAAYAAAGRVLGANDRINIAFIGCGMQFLVLVEMFQRRREQRNDVHISAVCDVWQPRLDNGLKVSGAERAYRDYREVFQRRDIDGVVLAVPDHWHHRMAREALEAGKDVYLEKPMTRTLEEAAELHALVEKTGRIMQIGGSGPASRLNWKIHEYIRAGKMGKILWGLISYNRNTREGMWDYPIPGVGSEHWPEARFAADSIDWEMWLGPAPSRPLSAERYFRWRKFWDYSTGNAGDLLYHRLGTMCTMLGFEFPTRAVAVGGIYVQKNREVPDTYLTLVEYPGDYSINMVSCMANATSVPLTIYGNWATLQVLEGQAAMDAMGDQRKAPPGTQRGPRAVAVVRAERPFVEEFRAANDGKTEVTIEPEPGPGLTDDWLDSMRSRKPPVYNSLRGYQVQAAISLGVESYRYGKVMAFDPVRRQRLETPPPHPEFPPAES